MQNVTK